MTPENEGQQPPSGRWLDFGLQDNAASFSQFLDKPGETESARKNPGFKTRIATWLKDLACDDELRAKSFAMATGALPGCEDRVTLALNHMQNAQLVYRAERGIFDNHYPSMAGHLNARWF